MTGFGLAPEKVAGILLIISFLSIVVGLIMVGAQGKLAGLASAF